MNVPRMTLGIYLRYFIIGRGYLISQHVGRIQFIYEEVCYSPTFELVLIYYIGQKQYKDRIFT